MQTPERVVVCGSRGRSEDSGAVREAALIAASCGAELLVTHAVSAEGLSSPSWATDENFLLDAGRDPDAQELDDVLRDGEIDPCRVGLLRKRGSAPSALDEVAHDVDALMIVVGSDGLDPERLVLAGSITAELLARAAHPLLIVAPWAGLTTQERVLAQPTAPLAAA
jgi:nucleotide-binding universal stress UspA family protein